MREVSSVPLLSIHTFFSIPLFCLRTANALLRLHRCTGCSGPSLSAYARRHSFVRVAHIIPSTMTQASSKRHRGYSNVCREYDFNFTSWSEKGTNEIYIFFTSRGEIKVISRQTFEFSFYYIHHFRSKRCKSCICKGKLDTQLCPLAVTYKNRITAGNLLPKENSSRNISA